MSATNVRLSEKAIEQLLPAHTEVLRNISENSGEGTDSEISVARDRYVVLTTDLCREPHVAPGLTHNVISEDSRRLC